MPSSLEKIINLVKKTGNDCIVLNQNGDPAFVLMNFDKYQKLALGSDISGLSEEQLLDKVNQEIALWKAANQDKDLEEWPEATEKTPEKPSEKPVMEEQNSLISAKNKEDEIKSAQDYFFEPVD
jgi:hypothetical protein